MRQCGVAQVLLKKWVGCAQSPHLYRQIIFKELHQNKMKSNNTTNWVFCTENFGNNTATVNERLANTVTDNNQYLVWHWRFGKSALGSERINKPSTMRKEHCTDHKTALAILAERDFQTALLLQSLENVASNVSPRRTKITLREILI